VLPLGGRNATGDGGWRGGGRVDPLAIDPRPVFARWLASWRAAAPTPFFWPIRP